MLRAGHELVDDLELDTTLRFVSALRAFGVPAYAALDLGVTWYTRRGVALSLVGQNLTERRHAEWGVRSGQGTEVERGVYAKLRWEY